MPRIFDNIEKSLLPSLKETLEVSDHADFCVGYFNMRGWKQIDSLIEKWSGGPGNCCRLLVGMQQLPKDELRKALSFMKSDYSLDNQTALRLKKRLAQEFRDQLAVGIPTNEDEIGLQRLAAQIKARKVVVKLYLRHTLHAKLYLLFRSDKVNPKIGFVGSSNLTFAGLSEQGELNVDVLDHDACDKLAQWFEDRWNDRWCIDISDELVQIIEESWAREELIPPYYIYLKMAYHLSQEARSGLAEFKIPKEFEDKLLEFQIAAIKIAAHHLHHRGGVLIGDVVGLGKTIMSTALAKIFEKDVGLETLIICPKNLVKMWEGYRYDYRLHAEILPLSRVINELPDLRRYRIVLIDESHNLRNRDGKRYRAIQEYIQQNDSRCILLSATPYNKTYLDLSNQLRLFVPEDKNLGIRPERFLQEIGETEFMRKYQSPVRSLSAFEKSEYTDDWQELMRLFLVRRTRSFIQNNYAKTDQKIGRRYLIFPTGERSYFPDRIPKTIKFRIDEQNKEDQYARLYASDVVNTINGLNLPRYGLGNYLAAKPHQPPTQNESKIIQDLSRAGKRLMGFSRTNLFKRLESSGTAFLQSVERHILRNYVYIHALQNSMDIPIGAQTPEMLDPRFFDEDAESTQVTGSFLDDENNSDESWHHDKLSVLSLEDYKNQAAEIYEYYSTTIKKRFKWLRSNLFIKSLLKDLEEDAAALFNILQKCGEWNPQKDEKLNALIQIVTEKHPTDKIIIFTQFADTVRYLSEQLKSRGISKCEGVTGDSADPTTIAYRFSPGSNNKRNLISSEHELRVIVATDVLSEGQNLQDCAIVLNYDQLSA